MNDIDPTIAKAQIEITFASIWSELRLIDFTEQEIQELKTMKHNLDYLKAFVELAKGGQKIQSDELESETGTRRNSD